MRNVSTRSTRKLAVLGVAALALVAACTPTGPPSTPPAQPGDGFTLSNSGFTKLRAEGFQIALFEPEAGNAWAQAAHDGLLPLFQNAAVQLQAHTGLAFSAAGSSWYGNWGTTVFPGVIAVNLINQENWPCSPSAVGCGGVSTSSNGRVTSGKVALRSDYVLAQLWKPNGAGIAELHTTVLHELGHALNLGHYDSLYTNGAGGTEYQTMHNSSPGNSRDYRLGDRNGLKYMAAGS